MIRQAVNPQYYDRAYYERKGVPFPLTLVPGDGFDHTDHCINSLRESLTCSVDISPIIWTWDDERSKSLPRLEAVPHVCRNFEKIREWAQKHKLGSFFDDSVHVDSETMRI
jgi:hypothetical protein